MGLVYITRSTGWLCVECGHHFTAVSATSSSCSVLPGLPHETVPWPYVSIGPIYNLGKFLDLGLPYFD